MGRLIKVDFLKIIKDKLFLIFAIVILGLSIVSPLLTYALQRIMAGIEGAEDFIPVIDVRSNLFVSFNITGSSGLIALILFSVLAIKERGGYAKNKITNGFSRRDIFLSLTLVLFILYVSILLVAMLITMSINFIFYPYSVNGYLFIEDIPYLLINFLAAILMSALVISMIMFFAVGCGIKVAPLIIAVAFIVLSLLGSALSVVDSQTTRYLNTIFNPAYLMDSMGSDGTTQLLIGWFVSIPVYIFLFLFSGFGIFNKKDLL